MIAVALVLGLLWNYPREVSPPPDRFIISYTAASGQTVEAMSVPPSPPAACTALAGATEHTHCAEWPTCPATGDVMIFWVQAAIGERLSQPSPLVTCHFVHACECTPVEMSTSNPSASAREISAETSMASSSTGLPVIPALMTMPALPTFNPTFPPSPT